MKRWQTPGAILLHVSSRVLAFVLSCTACFMQWIRGQETADSCPRGRSNWWVKGIVGVSVKLNEVMAL